MADFVNFGGFDPSPQNYLARQRFRDAQARQLGKDIGTIGGSLFDLYKKQKAEEMTQDILEAMNYEHDSEKPDPEFDAAMALAPVEEEIDVNFPTMFDKPKVVPLSEEEKQRREQRNLINKSESQRLQDRREDIVRAHDPEQGFDVSDQIADIDKEIAFYEEGEDPNQLDAVESASAELGMYDDPTLKYKKETGEIEFASPEEEAKHKKMRSIFKAGMSDRDKFYRAAALLLPYDPKRSKEMLKYGESLDRKEQDAGAQLKTALSEARVVLGITQNAVSNAREKWEADKSDPNADDLKAAIADYNKQSQYYNAVLNKWREASGIVIDLPTGETDLTKPKPTTTTVSGEDEIARKTNIRTAITNLPMTDDKGKYLTQAEYRNSLKSIEGIKPNEIEEQMNIFNAQEKAASERSGREEDLERRRQDQFRKQQGLARNVISDFGTKFKATTDFMNNIDNQEIQINSLQDAINKGNPQAAAAAIKAGIRAFDPGNVTEGDAEMFAGGVYSGKFKQMISLFRTGGENIATAKKIIKMMEGLKTEAHKAARSRSEKLADQANKELQDSGLDKYKIKAKPTDFYYNYNRGGGASGGASGSGKKRIYNPVTGKFE